MNLEIDNSLEQTKTKDKSAESFIKELNNALNKEKIDNIYQMLYIKKF